MCGGFFGGGVGGGGGFANKGGYYMALKITVLPQCEDSL